MCYCLFTVLRMLLDHLLCFVFCVHFFLAVVCFVFCSYVLSCSILFLFCYAFLFCVVIIVLLCVFVIPLLRTTFSVLCSFFFLFYTKRTYSKEDQTKDYIYVTNSIRSQIRVDYMLFVIDSREIILL